jgi:protein involved in polysaccharide export with SLBB domain
MFPAEFHEQGIRRVLTPRENPYPFGFSNATEPNPDDLVPTYEEYRIGVKDTVAVSIDDLLETARPWQAALEVSSTGYVRIPLLGPIRVLEMTEMELEQDLQLRIQEAGILPKPIVQVVVSLKRNLFFSALGDVGNPGPYGLTQPDTRLLDVLGQLGDIGVNAQKMYIIRRNDRYTPPPANIPEPALDENPKDDGLVIPPPDDDDDFGSFSAAAGRGGYQLAQDVTTEELGAILEPESPAQTQSRPARSGMTPLVYDPTTGETRESRAPPVGAQEEAWSDGEESEYDWGDIPDFELSQRVIEIDVSALKSGDPRYNIVLRNRDVINVPRDAGLFYVMGEVSRPGVYAFGGREITLKAAIGAIAGGLTPLAWPQRCEIIRRVAGTYRQITIPVNLDAVFAGLEDDVLLRGDDLVNVGTHFVAPFLFVIRNSFRFTYGFGFVYDRNFADQDSIAGRQNPETIERQRKAALGLPF